MKEILQSLLQGEIKAWVMVIFAVLVLSYVFKKLGQIRKRYSVAFHILTLLTIVLIVFAYHQNPESVISYWNNIVQWITKTVEAIW